MYAVTKIHLSCEAYDINTELSRFYFMMFKSNIDVSLRLRVQNAVPAQPCVGKY